MAQKRYKMSEEQWMQIKDLFPVAKAGRPPIDNRLIFNAILWLARSGSAWRDLPERFGSWKTVYSRFCKWRDDGTLLKIFHDRLVLMNFGKARQGMTTMMIAMLKRMSYFKLLMLFLFIKLRG